MPQTCAPMRGFVHDTRYAHGHALKVTLGGMQNSSTRAEIAGALLGLFVDAPITIHADSLNLVRH
eukprot:796418-Alexandrium_andersonii.AAC.1